MITHYHILSHVNMSWWHNVISVLTGWMSDWSSATKNQLQFELLRPKNDWGKEKLMTWVSFLVNYLHVLKNNDNCWHWCHCNYLGLICPHSYEQGKWAFCSRCQVKILTVIQYCIGPPTGPIMGLNLQAEWRDAWIALTSGCVAVSGGVRV